MDDHHLAWWALSELNLNFKQSHVLAQELWHGPTMLESKDTSIVEQIINAQQQTLATLTRQPLPQSLK